MPVAGTTSISNCTLRRAACLDSNWKFGVGALWFFSLEHSLTGVVDVDGLVIDSSPYEAIHFMTTNQAYTITNVSIRNTVVTNGVGTFVVQVIISMFTNNRLRSSVWKCIDLISRPLRCFDAGSSGRGSIFSERHGRTGSQMYGVVMVLCC